MYFRNCWYAAILESDTGNPKLKTGHDQTVSLFKINRYNCPEVRLCSRIKKKLLSRFQFGSDNPNLCTKVGKMFRAFFRCFASNPKTSCLCPFLGHVALGLVYKKDLPKDLPLSSCYPLSVLSVITWGKKILPLEQIAALCKRK